MCRDALNTRQCPVIEPVTIDPSGLIATCTLLNQCQQPTSDSPPERPVGVTGPPPPEPVATLAGCTGALAIGRSAFAVSLDLSQNNHATTAAINTATPNAGNIQARFFPALVLATAVTDAVAEPLATGGGTTGGGTTGTVEVRGDDAGAPVPTGAVFAASGSNARTVFARLSRCCSSGGVIASSQCTELMK